jgi:conjugative relaxase-like TrwC/TraI family protein
MRPKFHPLQLVSPVQVGRWSTVLTISRLSRWSINYYNDTANQAQAAAMDRQAAGGGLGEYYSESDTRVPTWVVAAAVGELTGLDSAALHGGFADTTVAARWLDDGIAPNGAAGRVFTQGSVHGFDLTFAAPKSVSLLRALTDDIGEKTMPMAHQKGIDPAMTYLHTPAGYTRVHNPLTGNKDLQPLPGLVGIACQHETSRCGDPHLHTHVIVPNRQARADGTLVSIDSKSLHHEAKAAGMIYQAVVRVGCPFPQPRGALRPSLEALPGDAGDLGHPGVLIDGVPHDTQHEGSPDAHLVRALRGWPSYRVVQR